MSKEESDQDVRGDSAAAAFALGAVHDPALAKDARHYLRVQSALAQVQAEELKEERKLRHWSLRVRHVSDVMRLSFELALAVIFSIVALCIGAAVWDAAHDKALVIEAFSVPPDLAARGLTGQAVAAQLLDRLQAMQDATDSARPADSYANNWGDDIKVEIPDTGVSLGEVHKLLVTWLGHQTHITGEVWHTADGLAITARAGGDGGSTVTGKEPDFKNLLQQAAERIYERTQPYRYAAYLAHDGDFAPGQGAEPLARGRAILQRLTVEGATSRERAWAVLGLGTNAQYSADVPKALAAYRQAATMLPSFALAWSDAQYEEAELEHEAQSLADARITERLLSRGDADMTPRATAISLANIHGVIAFQTGDFIGAVGPFTAAGSLPDYGGIAEESRELAAVAMGLLHEPAAAQAAWQAMPPAPTGESNADTRAGTKAQFDAAIGDWQAVLADRATAETALRRTSGRNQVPQLIWPYVAEAMAHTGDVAGAEALIATTPLDCDLCVEVRGDIAASKHDWNDANRWFALVSARTPSIPFADTHWGYALMQKGDRDGAIAKFSAAHDKGPHFADPLEYWGEALIAKNRSDLALEKFQEADLYAPNWGRLHLKWGEALVWSGDKADAAKQFAAAEALVLSPAEKLELARAHHG